MAVINKDTFTIGKDEFAVVRPSPAQAREANLYYNTMFSQAVNSGAMMRKTLRKHMKEQGIWSDTQDDEEKRLQDKIAYNEAAIAKGGITLKEARTLSIELLNLRNQLRLLYHEYNSLDTNTAESQAENARFNMLVSLCLVYNKTGERVYKSVDEYEEKAGEEVGFEGAKRLAALLYQVDSDFEKTLPENKFLLKYKFVDEKLRPIDKDGNLVDWEGRRINEAGRYINESGEYVDIHGNLVTEEGDKIVEFSPFLDDDGNPVIIDEEVEVEEAETEVAATTEEKPKKGSIVAKSAIYTPPPAN